jgi:hypothetical protein
MYYKVGIRRGEAYWCALVNPTLDVYPDPCNSGVIYNLTKHITFQAFSIYMLIQFSTKKPN